MKKRFCFLLPVMVAVVLSGCGGSSSSGISQTDYNAVVEERDKAQAELADLKESSVTKDDYDSIVAERDELKSKVEELEASAAKAAEEENKAEEEKKEEESNEPGVYGAIHYTVAPISIGDVYGHNWDIEKFEITGLEESGTDYRINYICAGSGDYGNITFFCYDEDGYQVDTFLVGVRTNSSSDKFKVEEYTYIPKSTVKIDIE